MLTPTILCAKYQVIEYAMKVTNGSNPTDVVPLAVRYPMLQMWVLIKQLLQQQINKTLGTASTGEEEVCCDTTHTLCRSFFTTIDQLPQYISLHAQLFLPPLA